MNELSLHPACLAGGGRCGAVLRSLDWSASPLGAVASWPQPLCTVVSLMLQSKFPMFVAWGAALTLLYNDAYADILGSKHPAAAGARLADVWHEIWPALSPIVADALAGKASFHQNAHYKVQRHGVEEDAWFVFSYSPIVGEGDAVGGMFCAVAETTEQVLASRHKLAENARLQHLFAQLQAAQDELKAASTRKDEFLAMLAHELRNPLAPIASAAELLARAPGDARIVQKSSAVIARQVGHMKELLDDLLDVSRVTRGLVALRMEEVDVQTILRDALDQANVPIQKKGQRLQLAVPAQACTLRGDKTRLVQIFANLLNNAAKFTPEGGTISLTMTTTPGMVAVEVADNGVGIAPTLLPHVFDLFTQGERSSDRMDGGLGLGLSLVRQLVELHGGAVKARSAGAGLGSSFTVELPLAGARVPAVP